MKGKNTVKQTVGWLFMALFLHGFPLHAQPGARPVYGAGRSLGQLKNWVFDPGSPAPRNHPVSGSHPWAAEGLLCTPVPRYFQSRPTLPALQWTAALLPFFCRLEHRLDKKNRVPLKFRLGSVDYVDWLEQKPNVCMSVY
ncbi:MAG: hypothetical protein IPM81_15750 [Saprospirales bacterium]|nr:hypothetical protein [Saprospirales bacterium]